MIGIYDMLILYCLPTGSLTAVLDNSDNPTPPIASVTFYDTEERPVKTVSTTHLANTHEQTETTYTLDDQPRKVSHTLKYKDDTYDDSYEYSYDRIGRLSGVTASFPSTDGNISITADTYNSIGQLIRSVSAGSETVYGYDIRGAISSLSNESVYQLITRNANGTIAGMFDNWIEHSYEYDKAGRLLSETCDAGGSLGGVFSSFYTYDRNSNILTLRRRGYPQGGVWPSGTVDDLTMIYDGNRLVKVTDNADEVLVEKSFDFHDGADLAAEYAYDANGYVTRDNNRGIADIAYNYLGLPSRIDICGDRSVEYVYDASGRKLSCLIKEADNFLIEDAPAVIFSLPSVGALPDPDRTVSAREYIGAYEFTDGQITRINTPYGYYADDVFTPYQRDYQGNNRNHASYYAYGLPVQESEVGDPDPYLYGGKEFYSLKGVNLYDFNARTYAADIARFMQPDPKAGDYHWLSPYAYCGGDPINFIDPTGCSTWVVLEPDGRYKVVGGDLNDNDLNVYVGTMQEDGTFIKESSIGMTPVITSFYDTDKEIWATDSYIDPNDMSGEIFFSNILRDPPPLFDDYMINAFGGHKYDFKTTNGTANFISDKHGYIYRGMPFGHTTNGKRIYTSARDIGNMAAGYIAAINGMGWKDSRIAFDLYQGSIEGMSTQKAEYLGWSIGYNRTSPFSRPLNLRDSISSLVKKLWNKLF